MPFSFLKSFAYAIAIGVVSSSASELPEVCIACLNVADMLQTKLHQNVTIEQWQAAVKTDCSKLYVPFIVSECEQLAYKVLNEDIPKHEKSYQLCNKIWMCPEESKAINLNAASEVDLCTDAADRAAIESSKPTFKETMSKCAHESWGDKAKTTQCVKDKFNFSESCSTCFGEVAHCTKSKCLLKCMTGEGPKCVACSTEKCVPGLNNCKGRSFLKQHKNIYQIENIFEPVFEIVTIFCQNMGLV
eukprot:Awhi_evm2s14776